MRSSLPMGTRARLRPPGSGRLGPDHLFARPSSAESLFLALLVAVVLAAVAAYGQLTGAFAWFLAVVVAAAAGLIAVRSVARNTEDPKPLPSSGRLAGETSGELRVLARTVERARAGFAYSQAIVAARAVEAFLEKVRQSRGLSAEELDRSRGDRAVLLDLIGDPQLADFVFDNHRYRRDWPRPSAHGSPQADFGPTLTRVLRAMEGWS